MALDGREVAGFTIQLGRYGNGRPALTIYGSDGVPHDRVTVNLVDHPLEDGEFHVKLETVRTTPKFLRALKAEDIAHPTGVIVSSGRVEDYAEVWSLGPRPEKSANEAPC